MDSFVFFCSSWIVQLLLVLGYNDILGRKNAEINERFYRLEKEQSYLRNKIHHLMLADDKDTSADANTEEDHDE